MARVDGDGRYIFLYNNKTPARSWNKNNRRCIIRRARTSEPRDQGDSVYF